MTASRLRALLDRAGLDEHVLATLLSRAWLLVAGAASVILVPLWLTPTEQGFYYTFASVLGLQIFFELGLSQVVMQQVGRQVAHLTITPDQELVGDDARIGSLASLVQLLGKWYLIAAALFAILCGVTGAIFFVRTGNLAWTQWIGVWSALVAFTAINLSFVPRLALLEGSGQVGKVAHLRLIQGLVGYSAVWLLLWSGAGLWVAMIIPCVNAVMTWFWLRRHGGLFRWLSAFRYKPSHRIDWLRDVLPFQWRIALSWISGYFIFYLFTPIVFAKQGAVEAGRLGLALTVFSALSTIGMSWVSAKAPTFAMLISRGERSALNALFRAVCLRSIAFTVLMCICIVGAAFVLSAHGVQLMTRIAAPGALAFLAVVCVLNTAVFCMAVYMRAHGEEPMLAQSIAMGTCTLAVAFFLSEWGTLPMVAMYAALTALVSVPWAAWIFYGYYRRTI